MIYCSSIWGLGSKSSLNNIFTAQKKAVRAISHTKLYYKDETTETYTYGHTKNIFNSYEFLTIHNIVLTQALSHMHKIYTEHSPKPIQTIFNRLSPPTTPNNIITESTLNRLHRLGLDTTNIILTDQNSLQYFTPHASRLTKQKQSLYYLGPLIYNHFCNKIQTNIRTNNFKYNIHNFTPKTFNNHTKTQILSEQSLGPPDKWEPINTPIYTISTSTITLRSQPLDK